MFSSCRRGFAGFNRWLAAKPAIFLILALAFAIPLHAQQRTYVFSGSTNFVTGSTDNLTTSIVGQPLGRTPLKFFYSAYPSITMTSTGARSALNASYTFGIDRTHTSLKATSQSHAVSVGFSRPLSPRWNINLSESFEQTADATTFNALSGVTPAPQNAPFLFYPVAVRLSARTNAVNIGGGYTLSERSSFSMSASHNLRNYGSDSSFRGSLSDQHSFSGNVTYARKTGPNETWSVGYSGTRSSFSDFENASSHAARMGYSNQIAPDLTFQLTAGASRVKSLASAGSYTGYNSSAGLQKTLFANSSLSLNYSQNSGASSGLGSISDTRTAGVSLRHDFSASSVAVNLALFDADGTLNNPHGTRGISATASIAAPVTRKLSVVGGGAYQRYTGSSVFGFTQKRLFVSLRYIEPNLWRFSR